MSNILSVIIKQLVDKIEKREFYSNLRFQLLDTNAILNEILEQFNNVLKYINYTEQEITRLNNDKNRLNSELLKIQLELMEYKKKESDAKK